MFISFDSLVNYFFDCWVLCFVVLGGKDRTEAHSLPSENLNPVGNRHEETTGTVCSIERERTRKDKATDNYFCLAKATKKVEKPQS